MPGNKKKEPKFLSFISQNFSSFNRSKTNVNEKEPACPLNTLNQLLESSSLAVPKSNFSLRTNKSKPRNPSSRQEHVVNLTSDNISSGNNGMMNNASVGGSKSVNVNQGSVMNPPCMDSSGFAVPTMRAPRAVQKNDANMMVEEVMQNAMRAWCILDEDTSSKLFSIFMFDCLNHIEVSFQDNESQHEMSDEKDSIIMVKEWLNKLDETPLSGMVSSGQFGSGLRDIDNVSSISGYNSIRQGPSHGNLNYSELRPVKPLLPRFMTVDPSVVGLPAFNPYGNQNGTMRSNASVAGMPDQPFSERAMSMRMDGSFMSNRNCMDNVSVYSAMPYTPAYSHFNQPTYRGGGNNHPSNAYFSNRKLHSLMEERENAPYSNNYGNISYLDHTRRDQGGLRSRDFQPRVMLDRLEYVDNGLSNVPAFSNVHGRTGSVKDFPKSNNHHPRYFDTSSSVRRNMEENEDVLERCSNAQIQSEYRMNDNSMFRRINGANEAVQDYIGRPFETRSMDSTMVRRINGANEVVQENIRRPFETRSKDSTMIGRINENIQDNIGRPFDNRSKDFTMGRRVNEDSHEKVGSRLFENTSKDSYILRRINNDDSQKVNIPHQSEYRSRDMSMHHIRENNDRKIASNSNRQIRNQAVENETPRPATRSATQAPAKYSITQTTAHVHAPTPAAARVMNQSEIVCVTRSGRAVRAPPSFWVADISYISTTNNQSNRGSKRKRGVN